MTRIQDVFYTTEFKKSNDTNYNFNIPLDININLLPNEKIKFKLINFSMMNSMLNISSYHKNNVFRVKYLNVDYYITIPNGSYTPTTLKDTINNLLVASNIGALVFNYDKITNKYYLNTISGITTNNLILYPLNCSLLFGMTSNSYQIIYPNIYYSDTYVNMLPYTKIIIGTNLAFDINSQYNLESKYSSNSGIGNIICWIPRDIPLFNTINYTNDNNNEIELANNNIKSINISLFNEYQEYILDAPSSYIHFQLIIYDTTNWYKKFYKIINDISYYLLSIYFNRNKKNI